MRSIIPTVTSVSPDVPIRRRRRASDVTAAKLGRATLGYLAVMMGIITLAPFQFAAAPVHGLTSIWTWSDVVMNVVMFLPFGFVYQLTRPAGSPASLPRVLLFGAALSGTVELSQLFEATRYSSLVDIVTNAAGAGLGAVLYTVALRRIEGENAVRTLALELPLMALVYLLVPLAWLMGLASAGGSRTWLVLPIAVFAGGILGTVHAAYLAPTRAASGGATGRGWLLLAALLWFTVALLPATMRDRPLLVAALTLTVATAWLRSIATERFRERHGNRRFELPTLRLVLPLFAAYLALSSLWPLDVANAPWRGTLTLLPDGAPLTNHLIYVMLEHIAAFTLVGFVVAEFYGRDQQRYRDVAPRVLGWGGGVSLLLEATRGWHPDYGASLLMLVFTIGACAFGGWLYQLQRDHIKALLARRSRAEIASSPSPSAAALVHADDRHHAA
jgi:glycopeptide antibiotics resistance protein